MAESVIHTISSAPRFSTEAERLLTVQEVAELLRVPVSWVYERTRRRGDQHFPHLKMGKYVRFRRAQIEAYLEGLHKG